jgi:tetratricopeptide (TPR) repeat protein
VIAGTHGCRLFVLFALLATVVYSGSFRVPWHFDDRPNILENSPIHITQLTPDTLKGALFAYPGQPGKLYRPVSVLSLALNWYAGGDNTLGYHIVNVFIHICAGWLLFLVVCLLFNTPRLKGRYPPDQICFIAVLAAGLWLVHPINSQAVVYIVQRMTSLAALFSLLTMLCYLRARLTDSAVKRILFFLLAALSWMLAVLSKENAVMMPAALLVLDIIFFPRERKANSTRSILLSALFAIACMAALVTLVHPQFFHTILSSYDHRPFTLVERVLTEQRVLLFYLSLLVFPRADRFSVDHDITLSTSIISPWTTIVAILINAAAILLALYFRKSRPLLSYGVLFFYVCHLVESGFIALELIFEHRNYLPSMFLFVPVAVLASNLLHSSSRPNRVRYLTGVLVMLLVFTLGLGTYKRTLVWLSEESLWADAMTKAPQNARPPENFAVAIFHQYGPPRYQEVMGLYHEALQKIYVRENMETNTLENIAKLHLLRGDLDEELRYYQEALAIQPDNSSLNIGVARALIRHQEFVAADEHLTTALDQNDNNETVLFYKGIVQLWLDNPQKALGYFQQALKLNHYNPNTMMGIGKALTDLGHYRQGRWFYLKTWNNGTELTPTFGMIENALLDEEANELSHHYASQLLEKHPVPSIAAMVNEQRPYRKIIPYSGTLVSSFLNKHIPPISPPDEDG